MQAIQEVFRLEGGDEYVESTKRCNHLRKSMHTSQEPQQQRYDDGYETEVDPAVGVETDIDSDPDTFVHIDLILVPDIDSNYSTNSDEYSDTDTTIMTSSKTY